jgi:hypothetical protein
MSGLQPRKVKKNVAMNPVARAVAMKNLRKEVTGSKIIFFGLDEGADASGILLSTGRFMTMVLVAAELDKLKDRSDIHRDMLAHIEVALAFLTEMSQNDNKWAKAKAHDLSDAIDYCEEITPELNPVSVRKAYDITY